MSSITAWPPSGPAQLAVDNGRRRARPATGDMASDLPQGHLTDREVVEILSIAEDAGAILIGGQSVSILARRYGARVPALRELGAITSADVDFFGSATQAQIVASRLASANLYLPEPFDVTPSAAKVVALIRNQHITIDFMAQIIWINERILQNRFLTLSGNGPDGQAVKILCLHPMDCLLSRLGNINTLHRRDGFSITSARASVMIIEGFIDELIEIEQTREAQGCFHELEFIIRRKCAGHPSFDVHGIDPTYILERFAADGRLDSRYREKTMYGMITRARTALNKKPRQ